MRAVPAPPWVGSIVALMETKVQCHDPVLFYFDVDRGAEMFIASDMEKI